MWTIYVLAKYTPTTKLCVVQLLKVNELPQENNANPTLICALAKHTYLPRATKLLKLINFFNNYLLFTATGQLSTANVKTKKSVENVLALWCPKIIRRVRCKNAPLFCECGAKIERYTNDKKSISDFYDWTFKWRPNQFSFSVEAKQKIYISRHMWSRHHVNNFFTSHTISRQPDELSRRISTNTLRKNDKEIANSLCLLKAIRRSMKTN